jgi:predicted HD phosphohydrolase
VSKLAEIFEKQGDGDYVGEAVSQREHAIQCAMHAERAFPRDKEIAVAALLHDIGHMIGLDPPLYAEVTKGTEFEKGIGRMEDCGIVGHEGIGAHFALQLGFSERVASIIRGHVAAKRYLCATQPQYLKNLSDASKVTLRHQGGPMSEAECRAYEAEGMLKLHLKMRYFDEIAKDPDCEMKPVEYYLTLADEVLANTERGNL